MAEETNTSESGDSGASAESGGNAESGDRTTTIVHKSSSGSGGQNFVILSAVGSLAVVIGANAYKRHTYPPAKQLLGLGLLYVIIAGAAEAEPKLAGPLSGMAFVSIALAQGLDFAKGVSNVEKYKGTLPSVSGGSAGSTGAAPPVGAGTSPAPFSMVDPITGAVGKVTSVVGKIIGMPWQGTHAKAFNVAGGSDNWQSENAVDIALPVGTPVYAPADGIVGSRIGSLGASSGRFAGLRVNLDSPGNSFYFAHLSSIAVHAGQKVKKGQLIGLSGSANGTAHLHLASRYGNPQAYAK